MTPEEKKPLRFGWEEEKDDEYEQGYKAGVAAEREECARVAEKYSQSFGGEIAAAIRARK